MNFSRKSNEPVIPPTHILLASQSIGRRTLLEKLGIRFRIVVSRVDEENIIDKDPLKMIKKRAIAKADEVVKHPKVYGISDVAKNIVITADSMAVLGKNAYGKAPERDMARAMLKELMGHTHTFATSIVIVHMEGHVEKKRWEKQVETKVTLGKLTSSELDGYVARYDFSRFAAGYSLNETPWDLVTKIDGSYTNVIGLPFEVLLPALRTLEVIV